MVSCTNQKKNNVTTTESGLQYQILKAGIGDIAKEGDLVIVHESMSYMNGTELFSTEGMKNSPRILIGGKQAIEGVDEGIRGMQVGEIRELTVPPSLSKRKQYPNFLSPDSTLVYKIELIELNPSEQ